MSTFLPAPVTCPHCGTTVEANVARTVNAQRSPAYRAQILSNEFQRVTCQFCGEPFRFDHAFVYIDLERGQWIGCFALRDATKWRELEGASARSFHLACGPNAPKMARNFGQGVEVRTVFGYGALVEKILCLSAGIDDAELELVKLALTRGGQLPLARPAHRLVTIDDDNLVFANEQSGDDRQATVRCIEPSDDPLSVGLRSLLRRSPYVDAFKLIEGTSA